MNDGVNKIQAEFSGEELERIGQTVTEIDEAVGNAIIDLNRPDKEKSGIWNMIIAFYLVSKSKQVKTNPLTVMKGLNLQVEELNACNAHKDIGVE